VRRMAALLPLAPLLAALGACGSSGPAGLAATTYAHDACTAIATYEGTLTSQATAYQAVVTKANGMPVPLKAAAVNFLQQQVTGSSTLLAALQSLRQPAGHGGAQVKAALVTSAQSAHETFASQLMAVQSTLATDRTALFSILNTAQQQVTAAGQALSNGIESVGQYGDAALNGAFGADTTCGSL
jgi:hypothetical protein